MRYILSVLIFFNTSFLIAQSPSWSLLSEDYSKVISLKDSTYLLGQFPNSIFISGARQGSNSWKKRYAKIKFDLNTNQDFFISIIVKTSMGNKELIYTSSEKDTPYYLGLGQDSINNKWYTFSRNIENDLEKLYPNHKLESINAIVIKGRMYMKNIIFKDKLKDSIPHKKHTTLPKILLKQEFTQEHIETIDTYESNIDIEPIDSITVENETKNIAEISLSNKMILENEYLEELIANDFEEYDF